jgi:hypothetical protein
MTSNLKYNRLFTTLAMLFSLCGAEAQTAPALPRLVVNVMIDQLRTDYLEAFSPLFGERGFRRLMLEGSVFTQAEYPFARPDRASATACLHSGASPYDNGIPSERWLDRQSLRPIYCVDDAAYSGQLTAEKSSPLHLSVSTLGDELKVATEGKGIVISVSPFRDSAILSAGHAANGCFWLNDLTGQWCSTSYYGEFPSWALTYSRYNSLQKRIEDIVWVPSNDVVGNFSYFVSGGLKSPFSHRFKGDRAYREFKASGMVNEEVNRFAMHCMASAGMGLDAVTDMISLTYYAGNYDHRSVAECPMELQDTYVRLDNALGALIDDVEKRVGKGNALFVITGTGYNDEPVSNDLSKYRIPTGIFDMHRAEMLLNMYLIAVYGQGQWVETSLGNEIYLNLKLIEQRNVNLTEMLEMSSAFLIQLSGVKDVYTSQRLSLGAWTPGVSKLRNAYNPHRSGDIMVQVAPGWSLIGASGVSVNTKQEISRESYIAFPLFFMGTGFVSTIIDTPVSIDHVAPTVAKVLRIRSPNACALAPLRLSSNLR